MDTVYRFPQTNDCFLSIIYLLFYVIYLGEISASNHWLFAIYEHEHIKLGGLHFNTGVTLITTPKEQFSFFTTKKWQMSKSTYESGMIESCINLLNNPVTHTSGSPAPFPSSYISNLWVGALGSQKAKVKKCLEREKTAWLLVVENAAEHWTTKGVLTLSHSHPWVTRAHWVPVL